MTSRQIQDFYASHSLTSDPGSLAWMLDGLPTDIEELIDTIGGLLLHTSTATELFGEPKPADQGAGELTMERTLQEILTLDQAPFQIPRPAEGRLRVNCRGFAMMFITILRHQGIPARKRVGFEWAGWIHEIGEYWDGDRWVFVDPNPVNRDPIRTFLASLRGPGQQDSQTATIRAGEAFHPGSLAWRLCRSGRANPEQFRDSAQTGMAGVRVALIQDLDSLNKVELRSYDEWHEMITMPWDNLSEPSRDWLDQAADLIEQSDTRFDEMRTFYANSSYGTAVQTRLAQLVD